MLTSKKLIITGTIRIKSKNLKTYIWKKNSWKKSIKKFPEAIQVIELFKAHNNFDLLIDEKKPEFLKGQLYLNEKVQGARINVLPDGKKLNKAYSLFSKNLTIHDESSNSHWDVLYQNPGGTFSYVYTLEKEKKASKHKYQIEQDFEKNIEKIEKNVLKGLKNKKDNFAVPMYTLLKTFMRVGNEIYFKAHKHKGLTTLKKEDISINDTKVTFKYKAKDGVPRKITEEFPNEYINRLKELLKPLKKNSFVFMDEKTNHPLKDTQFKKAFKKYCGKEFYPHIVRSYYATIQTKNFLKKHKTTNKKELKEFYLSIAKKLGHKKFNKKKHKWENWSNVTIHHYIKPDLVTKLNKLAEK